MPKRNNEKKGQKAKSKKERIQNKIKSKNLDNIIKSQSMILALMIMSYMFLVLVIYSILQILNINKAFSIIEILSIIIPIVIFLLNYQNSQKNKILTIALYLCILLITPFIFSKTYDLTVDGNSYHKTAIAFLKNGWNPLYETSREFQKNNKYVVPIEKDSKIDLWIEHYPKATWILAANIYNMTGNIESGKSITLILAIVLILISYNCLKTILSRNWSIIISILIALNPITLTQIFTYYLDSIMGICFTIELILLLLINPKEKQKLWIWIALTSICTIFVNLKFTGLLYSGLLAAVFYFYWLIKYRKDNNIKNIFKNMTINFSAVFIIAIFIVGANSYIKNTIDHKMPLYPLFGDGKVDIITTMQPKMFNEISSPQKFVWSLFSKTENVTYQSGKNPKLKMPLKVYESEKKALLLPDTRIAGFGPLFALSIILSIIFLIISYIKMYKKDKKNITTINLILISILITILAVGEGWWARYIPQLYIVPVLTVSILVYLLDKSDHKKILYIGIILIISTIVLNTSMFVNANYKHIQSFRQINDDIEYLKTLDNAEISLPDKELGGYLYTLNDNGVQYRLLDDIDDKNKLYVYYWRLELKVNGKD